MWFVIVMNFCVGGICNDETALGVGSKTKEQCEQVRSDLAAGRASFIRLEGKNAKVPMSVTVCRKK